MAGLTPLAGAAPYCASKHAVVGLTESLFIELRTEGVPIGVSCLCPGFVRTDLMDAPWTDRLGERPPAATDAVGTRTMDLLREGVEHGMAPSEVAAAVVDAVRADRFWILTHPETRHAPVARMARAARQENPLLWPDSRHHELVRLRQLFTARVGDIRARLRRP
jgi:NAD(P)-dependent dehydrogenase (short-subunit alcohol dehydrogenase family)